MKIKLIMCFFIVMFFAGGCSKEKNELNNNEISKTEIEKTQNISKFPEEIVLVDEYNLQINAISKGFVNNKGQILLKIINKSDEKFAISLDKLYFSEIEKKANLLCEIDSNSTINEYIKIEDIHSLEDLNDKIEGAFILNGNENNQYKFLFKT